MTINAAFTRFPSLTTNRLHLRQRYYIRGQFEDQYCFGLVEDEWMRSKGH